MTIPIRDGIADVTVTVSDHLTYNREWEFCEILLTRRENPLSVDDTHVEMTVRSGGAETVVYLTGVELDALIDDLTAIQTYYREEGK